MKIITFALALTVLMSSTTTFADPPPVGSAAPAFTLKDLKGAKVSLASKRGKVVLLDFWATWCGECQRSLPYLNSLQAKFDRSKLEVIGINLDSKKEKAEGFITKNSLSAMTCLWDPKKETPNSYHLKVFPTSVLLDETGKVLATYTQLNSAAKKDLEKKIAENI